MANRWAVVPVLLLAGLAGACGQKGPLYLPGEEGGETLPEKAVTEEQQTVDETDDPDI